MLCSSTNSFISAWLRASTDLPRSKPFSWAPALDELIRAESLLALFAVHEGIREAPHVTGGHPHLGVHQNGRVQAHVVGGLLHKLLPPSPLDIVLELHAQGP